MKDWIEKNLTLNGKLVAKRCKQEWFQKNLNQYIERYNTIISWTSFLHNPTFPQRIWHIVNDQYKPVKCCNPVCDKSPKFLSFTRGYLRTCSNHCAQMDPVTVDKIKTTNQKRYGSDYGLSNSDVISKRKQTCLKNFGVDNPTKSKIVLEQIAKSNKKKYGVEWILSNQIKKEDSVLKKYGVRNVQQSAVVRNRTIRTRRSQFYDSLFDTNRLNGMVVPKFTKEEYLNGGLYQNYDFECDKCGTIFKDCLEDGDIPRCPECFKGKSFFEKEVGEFIKLLGIEFDENRREILSNNQELDIYIPSKKIAIECDGLFWHGESNGKKSKEYHLSKTSQCATKGIRLIHIFEDEWMSKRTIVENRLRDILGVDTGRVFARKCQVKDVSAVDSNVFLEKYHLQGKDKGSIRLGLYFKDELVSLMSFGKPRVALGFDTNKPSKIYELIRFASSKKVTGGASKLLSHFIKTYKPTKIVSYADRRWSIGNLYERLGFRKINDGTPNYWYFGRGDKYKRHHRFGFAKHTLRKKLKDYNPDLTEWENMRNHGWDRIWDCGSFRYEMMF